MEPLPGTDDLLRVMTILGIPGDPLLIMQDHADDRRRAALLAHIAAGVVAQLGALESLAGLDVDDRADLHRRADRETAGRGRPTTALQLARLAWVQQAVARDRGVRPDPVSDTVSTTLGALMQLLEHPGTDPMRTDALLALRDAADHLATTLRATHHEAV
ncbi:hypothetical protein [Dactylosporangium fulvum]|uniref:Uncharacterized protein n=1 Tax=Dactylosporangium fulvum TaxID=53359 RepID=A0ABY5VM34_9ACTN|nr:hypothetical protein [Dactylosporangium fulvum]UWP78608.1 hypothetical protein Dfulv_25865 [Dactylosporangium fulvum]